MIESLARRVLPDALFDPPPADRAADRAGHAATREARRATDRVQRAVEDWEAALRWERSFWERQREEQEERHGPDDAG